jgi:hypothetical protein
MAVFIWLESGLVRIEEGSNLDKTRKCVFVLWVFSPGSFGYSAGAQH